MFQTESVEFESSQTKCATSQKELLSEHCQKYHVISTSSGAQQTYSLSQPLHSSVFDHTYLGALLAKGLLCTSKQLSQAASSAFLTPQSLTTSIYVHCLRNTYSAHANT